MKTIQRYEDFLNEIVRHPMKDNYRRTTDAAELYYNLTVDGKAEYRITDGAIYLHIFTEVRIIDREHKFELQCYELDTNINRGNVDISKLVFNKLDNVMLEAQSIFTADNIVEYGKKAKAKSLQKFQSILKRLSKKYKQSIVNIGYVYRNIYCIHYKIDTDDIYLYFVKEA